MGSFKKIIFLIFIAFCHNLHSFFTDEEKSHLFFLVHKDQIEKAFDEYHKLYKKKNSHDNEILQQMSFIMLQNGIINSDINTRQISLYGAGMAGSTKSIDILQKGLLSPYLETQLISIHFFKNNFNQRCDDLLIKAMSSDFLMTRMEAAYILAQRKHPHAAGQIEALMHKLPKEFKPFFPSLFATLSTPDSSRIIKHLLHDENLYVRIESILAIARTNQDDLIPSLRHRLSHSNIAELEATIYSLGVLNDNLSYENIKKILSTSSVNVRVAVARALYMLGNKKAKDYLTNLAKKKNLLAIATLGEIAGSEDVLVSLLNEDLSTRINAATALLKRNDIRCVPVLLEIFLSDDRDLLLQPAFSLGRTITYWKVVTSAHMRKKDRTIDPGVSLHVREYLLKEALDLPDDAFEQIAKVLFSYRQNDLIPHSISLLENKRSAACIALLKEYSNKPGSPLIRDYCHLALFRMKEEGDYEKYVVDWTKRNKDFPVIHLRPLLPFSSRLEGSTYKLSVEETSRLLIEMYFAIASCQNDEMVDILIKAIKTGDETNRYILAGLLLRATE